MADETDVFAAKGSAFGSTIADRLKNSNVSQIDDKIITVVNGKLKWNEDFESLKYFIKTILNLTGKWSSLGGNLKLFDEDSGRLIVRFYTNSASLLFQGDEGNTLNNILIEKIVGKLESVQDIINESGNNNICASLEETLLCKSISSSNLSTDFASSLPYDDTGYPCSSTIRDNILPGELETGVSKHAKANIACQTFGEETDEIQTLHINSQVNGTQQVITDIKSLKTTITKLESMVHSLENTIKDHDAVLSLYSNAADLNVKYLKELNDNKQHIISLEEKLVKVEEERDSLQLAIRLIAQDKYRQNEAATSASTINSESCNHKEWSKVHKSNNILGKTG